MIAQATRSAGMRSAYQPLVIVLPAVCGGIVLDRAIGLSIAWWWPAALVAWILWWLVWRSGRNQIATIVLLVSLAATGGAWHCCHWSLYPTDHVGLFARDALGPVAVEVRALGGPRRIPAPPP